jgi:hypothetical protein
MRGFMLASLLIGGGWERESPYRLPYLPANAGATSRGACAWGIWKDDDLGYVRPCGGEGDVRPGWHCGPAIPLRPEREAAPPGRAPRQGGWRRRQATNLGGQLLVQEASGSSARSASCLSSSWTVRAPNAVPFGEQGQDPVLIACTVASFRRADKFGIFPFGCEKSADHAEIG